MSKLEIEKICKVLDRINTKEIKLSASIGELDDESLIRLKASGLRRLHNNLETAESYFRNVCTTHSFNDKVSNIKRIK